MRKIGSGFLVLALSLMLWFEAAAAAEVQVKATVDRNEMSVGDTLTYTISVNSESSVNAEDPRLPDLQGFELINAWSGSESRSTFANGTFQVEQSQSFNYMLSATQEGTLQIGASQIVVNGQAYSTVPIQIKVVSRGARRLPGPPPSQPTPSDEADPMEDLFNQLLRRRMAPGLRAQPTNPEDSFFIQAEVDATRVYEGQQITASWQLYTRGQIHDIDTLKYPSLSGFWKEEIELATRLNFQQEIINGIPYQKALLASYALFPIKAGAAKVDAYRAKCTVSVPSAFGFARPMQYTKASTPISIEVLPLPTEGRPASFTGAVGQFEVSGRLDETNVPQHQPMSIHLRVQGRGNAKLIDLPALSLPPNFELYDTKKEAKFFKDGTSYKTFELRIVPRAAGVFLLDPIKFSAFDPQQKKYYEFSSTALSINVLAASGPQAKTTQDSPLPQVAQNDRPGLPQVLAEWQPSSQWTLAERAVTWSALYAVILLGLFVLLGFEMGWLKRQKDIHQLFTERMKRVEARRRAKDWRGVGVEGTNLMNFVLGEISGQGGASLELDKLLLASPPSVRRELSGELTRVKERLELLSFAPEDLVGSQKEPKALKILVSELESTLGKAIKLGAKAPLPTEDLDHASV